MSEAKGGCVPGTGDLTVNLLPGEKVVKADYIPWEDLARVIANKRDFGRLAERNPTTLSYYYAKENEGTLNPLRVAQGLVESGTHEWYVKDNIIGVREKTND